MDILILILVVFLSWLIFMPLALKEFKKIGELRKQNKEIKKEVTNERKETKSKIF